MKTSRRQFLTSAAAVSTAFLGLHRFTQSAFGQAAPGTGGRWRGGSRKDPDYQNEVNRYGPLIPDPNRIFDLPKDFRYTILSRTGDVMTDGLHTPGAPDGMATFPGPNGRVILIRNHELTADMTFDGPFGIDRSLMQSFDRAKMYDPGEGVRPHMGGTTTLVYDPKTQRVEQQFLSLAGTCRNCAGGPTPWNSWISCEEVVDVSWEAEKKAKERRRRVEREDGAAEPEPERRTNYNEKNHGYTFEVPATAEPALADPVPIIGMGRFYHEAIAVDPASGVVFQTEDREDGLIYRYIPDQPGRLVAGGKLQALAIKGQKSVDTRNWPETGKPKIPLNTTLEVEWINLKDVESPRDDLRTRGFRAGAARFARGEGMWYGRGEVFFACTDGGIGKVGQIFRYRPSIYEGTEREAEAPGRLMLYLEPNNTHLIQSCDNVTIAPWGDLMICEDGLEHNYLRGVTPEGKIYTLGDHAYHTLSELCGVCFAPNHPTLFVNLMRPGLTIAITGPWNSA
jgi:secreted PhoX family phosphatase